MSLNQLGLGFVFTAKDLASGVIGRVRENVDKLGAHTERLGHLVEGNFARFAKGLAIFGAGMGLVGSAFELTEKADKFVTMVEQAGAASNASAEEMEELRKAALDKALGGAGASAEGAAETLKELALEGYNAKDAMKALGPTMGLVAIGFDQLTRNQAASLVSRTLGEFRLGAEQAGPLVDKLALSMRLFGIRATELEPALRGVATGVALSGAGLDDTLIALGLTKTVLPSVEQAARSVNLAFNQLANDKTRKELKHLGITVADSAGTMRPLIEILADLASRTGRMTEAQRAGALASIFSARAGGGLTVIMDALRNGIRTASGEVVTGAAAIAELRNQMAASAGTAGRVKERMLDTFGGQQKALKNVLGTLGALVGEPFVEVFKPIVSALREFFLAVARFVRAIPEPVKMFVARMTVAAGAVLAMIGAVLAAKAAIPLLVLGLKFLGVTAGGLALTLLPAVLIFGVLATVVAAFHLAWRRNVGGIADLAESMWRRVKLTFQALAQLFSQGGFSGAVRDELNRAEGQGVRAFAIRLYLIVHRIRQMLAGIAEGFSEAVARAGPVFGAFVAALRRLGEALGFVAQDNDPARAGAAYDAWGRAGKSLGQVLEKLAEIIVRVLTVSIEVATGTVRGFRQTWPLLRSAVEDVVAVFAALDHQLTPLLQKLGLVGAEVASDATGWESLGRVLGYVAGAAAFLATIVVGVLGIALSIVVGVVKAVIDVIEGLWDVLMGIGMFLDGVFAGDWARAWAGLKRVVFGVVNGIIQALLSLVEIFGNVIDILLRPLGIRLDAAKEIREAKRMAREFFAEDLGIQQYELGFGGAGQLRARPAAPRIASAPVGPMSSPEEYEKAIAAVVSMPPEMSYPGMPLPPPRPEEIASFVPAATTPTPVLMSPPPAVGTMPAAAQVGGVSGASEVERAALLSSLKEIESRPLQASMTLCVDGETLARATARAQRSEEARSFSSWPVSE